MYSVKEHLLKNYTGPQRNGHEMTPEIVSAIENELKEKALEYEKEQAQAQAMAVSQNIVLI